MHARDPKTLSAILKNAGLRMTRPRMAVLEMICQATEPLTIQEIQKRCSVIGQGINFSTVFRIMQMLEDLHLVCQVPLGRPAVHYELSKPDGHYDHITCRACGRVVHIPDPCPVEAYQRTLAQTTGFSNIDHSLAFFGICPSCTLSDSSVS
ncbi:MAG: Fur family transcriptional regulator [Verrucomicrobiia bacterium]